MPEHDGFFFLQSTPLNIKTSTMKIISALFTFILVGEMVKLLLSRDLDAPVIRHGPVPRGSSWRILKCSVTLFHRAPSRPRCRPTTSPRTASTPSPSPSSSSRSPWASWSRTLSSCSEWWEMRRLLNFLSFSLRKERLRIQTGLTLDSNFFFCTVLLTIPILW